MSELEAQLDWIDSRRESMVSHLRDWAEINTGSYNTSGLRRQSERLTEAFSPISDRCETRSLPDHETVTDEGEVRCRELGDLLLAANRRGSDRTVMLGAHMDTVFGPDHPFQTVKTDGDQRLVGPGVLDDKGGIVVMLVALRALERSSVANEVGWEVFINPDEEIGSPGSGDVLHNRAIDHDFGLIFEPPMPDGSMVTKRKGSGNFTVVVEGQSAHAGRNPNDGNDAVRLLSSLILDLHELDDRQDGVICNVGRVVGGGPVNVVPDRAVAKLNVRVDTPEDQRTATRKLDELIQQYESTEGFNLSIHGEFLACPKLFTDADRRLFEAIEEAGNLLALDMDRTSSGGVTDGNTLGNAGLPTIDTMGPLGGKIHTKNEYLHVESLTRRAKLAFIVLHRFARGELLTHDDSD